jgi:CheY-like chemotaxis protein
LRDLLCTELELERFYVFTAHNGAVGVEKIKTENSDAILMDVLMPGMNGIAATKTLKSDENTKHIPIIMVTSEGK